MLSFTNVMILFGVVFFVWIWLGARKEGRERELAEMKVKAEAHQRMVEATCAQARSYMRSPTERANEARANIREQERQLQGDRERYIDNLHKK